MERFEELTNQQMKNKLNSVDAEIKRLEKSDKFIEARYGNLLQERIMLSEKLTQTNEIIQAASRGDKYPSIEEYDLEGKVKLVLEYKNMFLKKADTMVSAIHVEKGFEPIERTATREFMVRNGRESFQQPKGLKSKGAGDFVILEHPELSAPMSHHILYYKDVMGTISLDDLDLDIIEKGIQNVLADCENRSLKTISFFPLGFDYVFKFPLDEKKEIETKEEKELRAKQFRMRNEASALLADRMAETIVQYFAKNHKTSIKTIYFGFISYKTMRTLDNAFHKWSAKTRQELYIQNELSRIQKNLIAQNNTEDEKFKKILRDISFSLSDESTIVLLGETGVGKSYISEILHNNSNRKHMPHIAVNCAVFSKNLAEPSLFGYVQGSHSEAKRDSVGPIERANGGTMFLDEIGTLDKDVQKMLLTFLDKGFFNRFGDYSTKIHSDVKLIFGTNADLEALVAMGKFAHDFYERIHHWVFTIPPLRERRGDIKILLQLFLEKMIQNNNYPMEIETNAEELLSTFNWYGNVRQLKLYIEKLYIKCKGENINKITIKIINAEPPRNTPITSGNDQQLEGLLKYYIGKWDKDKGKLIRDVIEPIAAKIYIDGKLSVSDSSKFLGITGSKGKNSPLQTQYSKYNEAITKLKNL